MPIVASVSASVSVGGNCIWWGSNLKWFCYYNAEKITITSAGDDLGGHSPLQAQIKMEVLSQIK